MALEDFSINGVSLPDLKVTEAVLEKATSAGSSLTLTLSRPIDAAGAFDPYEDITLKEGATSRWMGRLDRRASLAAGGKEGTQLVFRSIFQRLDLVKFRQEVYIETIASFEQLTSVMLNRGYVVEPGPGGSVTIQKITGNQQLSLMKAQMLADHSILVTGNLPELKPPFITKDNATVGSCLLSLMSWFPAYGIRDALGSLQIVHTLTSPQRTFDPATTRIALANISATDDLLKNKTTLKYLRRSGNKVVNIHVDEDSTGNGSPYELIETITLEEGEVVPDDGIAAQIQAWVGRLHLEAEIQVVGDLRWDIAEGDRAKLDGVLPEYGVEDTVIQTISRDLKRNRVTLQCGPRNHLGLDQLLELNRKPSYVPADTGGGPEADPTGKLQVIIHGLTGENATLATWSVGDQNGSGDQTIDLAVGEYSVVFNPVYTDDSRFFFAKAVTGLEVTTSGTTVATADYEEAFLGGKQGFQLVADGTGFKVLAGSIWGTPIGDQSYGGGGAGYVYGVISYNDSTGEKTGVEVQTFSGTQVNNDGTIYEPIGRWYQEGGELKLINYRFSPIIVQSCRQWGAYPIKYGVSVIG